MRFHRTISHLSLLFIEQSSPARSYADRYICRPSCAVKWFVSCASISPLLSILDTMGQRQKHKRVNRESKKPYFEPGQTCDRPKVDTVKVTMQRAHVLSKGDPIDRRGRDNAVPASLQMYNSDPLPEASGSASPKTKVRW